MRGGSYEGKSREQNQGYTDHVNYHINCVMVVGTILYRTQKISLGPSVSEEKVLALGKGRPRNDELGLNYENEVLLKIERHSEVKD